MQYGNYSQSNYKEAFKWFLKLSDFDGNATAQHFVGLMYATGIGSAVEPSQGAVSLISTRSDIVITLSYLCCEEWQHTI